MHLTHPLGHAERAGAEHLAVVQFLEGLAVALVAGHLADEQHQRRRVLEGGVDPDRRVAGAGSAGDEGHSGLAGELRVGIGHEGRAGLVAVDDQLDHLARVVQRVQDSEVAFPGHAERVVHALDQQLIDETSGAGAGRGHGGS